MRKELTVTNPVDNVKLHAYLEYDENSRKGLVQIFHGMAEHKERYDYFVKSLVREGYAVLNCDERGHGESAVVKGYFADEDGWNRNLDDLHSLYLEARKIIDLPYIVFGHSMGTLVARSYLKKYEDEITKLCMTGMACYNSATPVAIKLTQIIRAFKGKEYRSSLMNKLSFGAYNAEIENPRTEFDWLSVNNENVDNYIADDDCGYVFTIQGFYDMLSGMQDLYSTAGWNVRKKDLPIMFLSGSKDPCLGKMEGLNHAIKVLNDVGYSNISYKLYDGLRHEILNEKERDEVIKDIVDFLNN